MPRQPFLPTYKNHSYGIGARVIEQRPEFVSIIGKTLTLWPYVEHQFGVLLGIMLKAESGAAVAIFRKLRNATAQRDVLLAAAISLSADLHPLFRAILRLFESLAKERADLAHGHWGVLDAEADKAIWIEAKDHTPWNTLVLLAGEKGQHIGHDQLQKDAYVYRLADVQDVYDRVYELWRISFDFVGLARGSSAKGTYGLTGNALREHLCSLPSIIETLAATRDPKKIAWEDLETALATYPGIEPSEAPTIVAFLRERSKSVDPLA